MDEDTIKPRVMDLIRRGEPSLADALDNAEAGRHELTEMERARVDSWLYGQGFMLDGRRIDPSRLTIVRRLSGEGQ
jgi:hypothetical protein